MLYVYLKYQNEKNCECGLRRENSSFHFFFYHNKRLKIFNTLKTLTEKLMYLELKCDSE